MLWPVRADFEVSHRRVSKRLLIEALYTQVAEAVIAALDPA